MTYWDTPFSKVCVGMKVGSRIKFAKIDQKADSLHSLIADGQHRATSLGRDAWKDLIGSDASLQVNCNIRGLTLREPAVATRGQELVSLLTRKTTAVVVIPG